MESTGEKVQKIVKPKRKLQCFREEYSKAFPGVIIRSRKGENYANCTLCRQDFSVGHGGISDVNDHVGTKKHKSNANDSNSSGKISTFFVAPTDSLDVINAEVLFTEAIIEHGVPIAMADHMGPLFRRMFPDSKIAKKYGCGRTKTSNIIQCLGEESSQSIVDVIKSSPFSMSTDGSTDYDDVKLYPICVRYFDNQTGKVLSVLLSLRECNTASTGENIFKIIEKEMNSNNIPWDNLVCFAADNAAVMLGSKKGVASFITEKSPSAYIAGCSCHLIHLAVQRGAKQLPVKLDDLLVDVFYYLEKSSKRKQALRQFQEEEGLPKAKILKHVSTRWLSLEHCLDRLLQQWTALIKFFEAEVGHEKKSSMPSSRGRKRPYTPDVKKSEEKKRKLDTAAPQATDEKADSSKTFDLARYMFKEKEMADKSKKVKEKKKEDDTKTSSSKASLILTKMSDKNTLLYAHFLMAVLPIFNETNTFLQKDEPCVHLLHHVLSTQFRKLIMRLMKPKVIIAASDITKVNFKDRANQKDDEDLFIGTNCRDYVAEHAKECDLTTFFSSVRAFYSSTCSYMIRAFPFGDEVLVNARILDISYRQDCKFRQVRFFAERYPHLLTKDDKRSLEEEFLVYQCDPLTPAVTEAERVDTAWNELSKLKDPATGKAKFGALFKVAKSVLVIYHSNADCERIFSHVNKNKTEFRASLSTKVLGSLMTRKMMMTSSGYKCHSVTHSKDQLKKSKRCTMENK
ncbi:uncharacterized protein LOC144052536 [Vanacampus margaritifer]